MHHAIRRLAPLLCALSLLIAIPASASADNYVALGDSYSSGTGTGSYTLNAFCTRGVYAYPYLVYKQRAGTSLSFQACGGAVTSDVINTQSLALTSSTNIVTITIGGNDIGFGNLILACTFGDCTSDIAAANDRIRNELPAKLDATYATIRSKAPNARVIVLGYPRLAQGQTCSKATGMSLTEALATDSSADLLDQTIANRAQAAGFTYQSAIKQFTGHGVCSSTPWLNGYNAWAVAESYHPNKTGHSSGYVPLVRQIIG